MVPEILETYLRYQSIPVCVCGINVGAFDLQPSFIICLSFLCWLPVPAAMQRTLGNQEAALSKVLWGKLCVCVCVCVGLRAHPGWQCHSSTISNVQLSACVEFLFTDFFLFLNAYE